VAIGTLLLTVTTVAAKTGKREPAHV
jgi:hypothetical protein